MDYSFWFNMHSGVRWLVILAFIIVLFRYAVGYVRKGNFAAIDGKLMSLYSLLLVVQFLMGLLLLVLRGFSMTTAIVSHAVVMIAAVYVAATAGGGVKRAEGDTAKYQIGLVRTLLSALLVLLGVTLIGGW